MDGLCQRAQAGHGAAGVGAVGRQGVDRGHDLIGEELALHQPADGRTAGVEGVDVKLRALWRGGQIADLFADDGLNRVDLGRGRRPGHAAAIIDDHRHLIPPAELERWEGGRRGR